ncbi:MAG: uroporphyrinogen-III synthase [Proteobacteria bacterium]|nr:uroporphyrinogen-III synthase [Pseudomonadota bacterium]
MRILVTRPEEDAAEISKVLRAMGHDVIAAPLLHIKFYDGPEIALDNVQAILATSANGVRSVARRTPRRDVPLFAVGPQTQAEARAAGFTSIRNANGDGAALARATVQWAMPQGGTLLHAAGAEASKFLVAELQKSGFTVRREVLYEAQAAERFPDVAARALKAGALDAVLHFSSRSARIFAECVTREGLATACEKLIALCIGDAAAKALSPLHFREIRVAEAPNQQALLDLL